MYPGHNSTKAIQEARVRELHEDMQLQWAEQIIYAGLLARLRRWLAARRERHEAAAKSECPSQTVGRTNVLTLK